MGIDERLDTVRERCNTHDRALSKLRGRVLSLESAKPEPTAGEQTVSCLCMSLAWKARAGEVSARAEVKALHGKLTERCDRLGSERNNALAEVDRLEWRKDAWFAEALEADENAAAARADSVALKAEVERLKAELERLADARAPEMIDAVNKAMTPTTAVLHERDAARAEVKALHAELVESVAEVARLKAAALEDAESHRVWIKATNERLAKVLADVQKLEKNSPSAPVGNDAPDPQGPAGATVEGE